MIKLLIKDFRLSASALTYGFLTASLMTMLPGYPILMGAFFICLGIFHSFQDGRETNDILYTVLLPVQKSDVVRSKYAFTCTIQLMGFLLMAILTILRMTLLGDAEVYRSNALMNAGPLFLAFVLLVYSAFNLVFLRGFFKTAYRIGIPFLFFCIVTLILVTIGESLHFFPSLSFLNVPSGERIGLQITILCASALAYALITWSSCLQSIRSFEKLDL